MKTDIELECSLNAWILLRYMHDSCEKAQTGDWFKSPFDENSASLIGFHGQELNSAFAEILKGGFIEYRVSYANFPAYEIKIKPDGLWLTSSLP